MLQKIIHFIKYHNAFTIGLLLVFVFGAATLASETVRDTMIGEEIVTEQGIDNSRILAANLDNFNFAMTITNVLEDDENYYVDYRYNTLAIKDNAWQETTRTGTLTVSKVGLAGQDLGLYVAEELGEIIDSQFAYLKEVQEIENKKGQTFVRQTVKYTALLGLILDPETRELPGYVPVVQPPEPEVIAYQPEEPAEDGLLPIEEAPPEQAEDEQPQPAVQRTIDRELIRKIVLELLAQKQIQQPSGEEPICQPTTEICDGLDNDCDDLIDEELAQSCGTTDVGACQYGMQTCSNGVWGECLGAVEPTTEEIYDDGIDNNCDGQIDEGYQAETTE